MVKIALFAAFVGWVAAAMVAFYATRDRERAEILRGALERCESSRHELLRALDEQRAAVEVLRAELSSAEDRARQASIARDEAVRRIAALRRSRPVVEPDLCATIELPIKTRSWLIELAAGGQK